MQSKEFAGTFELKLPVADPIRSSRNGSDLTLHIADKEDSKLECWTELKVKDRFINKRSYHAAVIHKSRLYVYGGQDLNVGTFSDFNLIQLNEDLVLSHWEPVITKTKVSPGPLSRMSSVIEDDKWYLFGGTTSAVENTAKIWCYDFTKSEWSLVKPNEPSSPPSLDSHSACIYKNNQGKSIMIVFGGFLGGTHSEYWNQIIKYDITNKKWTLPYNGAIQIVNPAGPSPRAGHTASICNENMYVFGGTNGQIRFNDIWKYDLNTEKWQKIKTNENPPPRNGHSSVVYMNQGFVIFGGIQDITHEKDDLLFFNITTNQWITLDGAQDHSKLAALRNNERVNDSAKLHRSNRGKSMTETPGKVYGASPLKDSRRNTKGFGLSPSKRTTSPDREASPGKSRIQSNNSFALSQSELNASPSLARPYQGLSKENEEKKKKLFLVRKQNFLKEFEVTDPTEALKLTLKSPTTEAMKNSIIALNYKGHPEIEASQSQSPLKKKKTGLFGELMGDSFIKVKIPINGKVAGRKPCARDGHSSSIFGNKMIVFGGDRHKMCFNDIFMLNIKQIITPSEKEAL